MISPADLPRNLSRMLSPVSVAVAGANESLGMSNNAVIPMLEAGIDVHLVNPRRDSLYGRSVHSTLTDIGEPVDAVLGLVNAERAVALVEEAAALGCGGVVVTAAGFGELGDDGAILQRRLHDTATEAGLAVIGPNCAGFKNVSLDVNLFTGGRLDLASGPLSVVSQSGFLARSVLAAAQDRRLGVSIAISSGNEAVCDLADHVQALSADPATTVICLVVETIRRPDAFFAAVAEARSVGKAVIALKLGRNNRSRRIMASHTGAIADESWVYELAFAEHGIVSVHDLDHMLDAAQLLVQLPPEERGPVERIGIITTSGGVAALATDLAEDVGAPVPPLDEIEEWVRERVPGDTVNPLDLTGFVMTQRELTEELFEKYADVVDLLVLSWWTGQHDEGWSTTLLEPFAAVADRHRTTFAVSPVEATSVGDWVDGWRGRGLNFARGIDSVYRAVAALNTHCRATARSVHAVEPPPEPSPDSVASEIGPILSFSDAMQLLTDAGIAVAPHVVIAAGDAVPPTAQLGDRLAVKLADVPHRTELDAVSVGVAPEDLLTEVERLRAIAADHAVPATVAVQSMVSGHGEAFAGIQGRTGLGPVVLFGPGGVMVESGDQVRGRLLPVDAEAAASLVDDAAGPAAFAGRRGQTAWAVEPMERLIADLDRIWRRHGSWLESLDINPLIVTPDGLIAVDALVVVSP